MIDKIGIKCVNDEVHKNHEGRLLCILDKDCIYVHCKHANCKRWTKLKISFPGISLDFTKAAIIRELLPSDYHFDFDEAVTVVESK